MAGDINNVVLVGRITKDAELKYTAGGTALSSFSIASSRRVKKADEWKDETSFFELALWDKQAESLNKYLLKGTQVGVAGELRQDRWEKDGQKFSKIQVFVNSIQLLGSPKGTGASAPSESGPDDRMPEDGPDAGF